MHADFQEFALNYDVKMVFDMNLNSSSKVYHSSKIGKDTVFPRKVKEGSKRNGESTVGSGNSQLESSKTTSARDNEVVKYMFSLPAYLQRVNSVEDTTGKALNVGVLDWSRLEIWTGKQTNTNSGDRKNGIPRGDKGLSSNMGTPVYGGSHVVQEKQSFGKMKQPAISPATISRPYSSQLKSEENWTSMSTLQNHMPKKYIGGDKSQLLYSKIRKSRDDFDKCSSFSNGGQSSESREFGVRNRMTKGCHGSCDGQTGQGARAGRNCISELTVDLTDDNNNVVGMLPCAKKFGASEDNTTVSYTNDKSFDQTYLGSSCSSNVQISDHISESPRFSPVETYDSRPEPNYKGPGQSTGVLKKSGGAKDLNGISRTAHEEFAGFTPRTKGHSSPSRHFGSTFSKMTRSFSFKESSSGKALDAACTYANSGPITSDDCPCSDSFRKQRSNTHGRARASPLRRIFDPLLKFKSSSSRNSSSNDLSSVGCTKASDWKPVLVNSLPQTADFAKPFEHARLQIMVQNGYPLFRFMVNNSPSVFAATKAKVASPVKSESGSIYTIYSVEEIKKKNGTWMHHSNKEKNGGYVYNIVGQMKINCSSVSHKTQNFSDIPNEAKESVLFGIERIQKGNISPQFRATKELAAMVISKSNQRSELRTSNCQMKKRVSKSLSDDYFRDNQRTSITVILPGAVHSLPNKGGPSPLIQRWKTGGLCDCGGWDVGCKLNVLSNDYQHLEVSDPITPSDCLQLFSQEGSTDSEPQLSLSRVEKGLYSVKFCSSISLLQAFFICVAVIGNQSSSDSNDIGFLYDDNYGMEFNLAHVLKSGHRKSFQG